MSDFIKRYSEGLPEATWAQMKTELSGRFSEVTDARYAFLLLRRGHQKPGETLKVYAEHLIALTEDAFENQSRDN